MADTERVTDLLAAVAGSRIPRDADGPVFREPWEARAFAIVLALHEIGSFDWPEWTHVLGEEISRARALGDPDLGDTYFTHWLNSLERLVSEKELAEYATLRAYQRGWGRAAERTRHGAPIELQPEDLMSL